MGQQHRGCLRAAWRRQDTSWDSSLGLSGEPLPPIHTNSQGGKRLQERPMGQEPGGPQRTRTPGGAAECLSVASLMGKSSESGRPNPLTAIQAESRSCPEAGRSSSWRAEVWEERGSGSVYWGDREAGAWSWASGSPTNPSQSKLWQLSLRSLDEAQVLCLSRETRCIS